MRLVLRVLHELMEKMIDSQMALNWVSSLAGMMVYWKAEQKAGPMVLKIAALMIHLA